MRRSPLFLLRALLSPLLSQGLGLWELPLRELFLALRISKASVPEVGEVVKNRSWPLPWLSHLLTRRAPMPLRNVSIPTWFPPLRDRTQNVALLSSKVPDSQSMNLSLIIWDLRPTLGKHHLFREVLLPRPGFAAGCCWRAVSAQDRNPGFSEVELSATTITVLHMEGVSRGHWRTGTVSLFPPLSCRNNSRGDSHTRIQKGWELRLWSQSPWVQIPI